MTWLADLFGPYLIYTIIGIVIIFSALTWFVVSNMKKPKQRDNNNPLPTKDMVISGAYREGTSANTLAKLTNEMIEASQNVVRNARRNARQRPSSIVKECDETLNDLNASRDQILRWKSDIDNVLEAIEVSMDETEELKENTYRANPSLRPQKSDQVP